MHLNQIVTISAEVLAQEVSGEMVLLDLNSEQYLGLNEVGARVWQLLEGNKSLKLIHEKVMSEYDVEAEILETDLIKLITDMRDSGIVTIVEQND